MAKLGSEARPAVVRVRNIAKAESIVALCEENGWKVVVGVEPDRTEDLTDLDKLTGVAPRSSRTTVSMPKIGRNEPCPCGSGKKFKKCCGREGGVQARAPGGIQNEEDAPSFIPIGIDEYVEMHVKSNPGESPVELRNRLQELVSLINAGQKCSCGNTPWAIGSAVAGLACFTCITGEAQPSTDYELVEVLRGGV